MFTVEFTTMEQIEKNLQLIHLVNYNMNLDGEVTSTKDVQIKFRIPDGKTVSKLTFGSPLTDTAEISYETQDQYIEIKIPSFEVYGLATVYFK